MSINALSFEIFFRSFSNFLSASVFVFINKNIISINSKLEDNCNFYKLYKYNGNFLHSNKYYLIVNNDIYLDKSVSLLNIYVNKLNNL